MQGKPQADFLMTPGFDSEAKKKIDMGPKWLIPELDIFLQRFRQSGLNEAEIQRDLKAAGFSRSIKNIQSIYLKNKNFLTLKKNCSSIDLFAVMEDQYEEMEHDRKVRMVSESENMATLKRRKPVLTPEITKFEDPLRRRNNQESSEFFPHNKKIKYVGQNETPLSFRDFSVQKPKRKGPAPKSRPLKTFDIASTPLLFKLLEGLAKSCNGKSQRKPGRSIEDAVSIQTIRWAENEHFYSFIDAIFFSQNPVLDFLNYSNIAKLGKLSRIEWNFVRSSMGRPRRFSRAFIREETQKLNEFRNLVRGYLNETYDSAFLEARLRNRGALERIMKLSPLNVGQIVLALHPICGHFHSGSVLTTTNTSDQNIIKFFTNELGVHKIKDIWISTELCHSREDEQLFETQSLNNSNISVGGLNKKLEFLTQNEEKNTALINDEGILQDLDHYATSFFLKVLEKETYRKTALISELRNFNNYAETHQGELDERFTQEYGWIGVQINVLDNALKHICSKFRLRGLNNFQEIAKISENFDKILTNPLRDFLEKEGESIVNSDPSNQALLKDLKGILNKMTEERITHRITEMLEKQAVAPLEEKPSQGLDPEPKAQEPVVLEEDLNEEKEGKLKDVIFNCLGVLCSLKHTGEVVPTDNRFIKSLWTHITENNRDQFHEINDILLNLSIKNKI